MNDPKMLPSSLKDFQSFQGNININLNSNEVLKTKWIQIHLTQTGNSSNFNFNKKIFVAKYIYLLLMFPCKTIIISYENRFSFSSDNFEC